MSAFDELLAELKAEESLMAKAQTLADDTEGDDDDENIAAMADGDEDDDGIDDGEDEDTDLDDEEPLGKSFGVTLPTGQKVEAYDGTALVKSLFAQQQATEEKTQELFGSVVSMLKAMRVQHAQEIKALRKSLEAIGEQGRGRKSKVTIHEPPRSAATAETNPAEIASTIMSKANSAFSANKITGRELNTIDVSLRKGIAPSQDLLNKIMAQ
jgi:hypothetical protein